MISLGGSSVRGERVAPALTLEELVEEWPEGPFVFAAPSCALLAWWHAHFPSIPARLAEASPT